MARHTGMSQNAISRIWRAFALQPHRSETFKFSKDPLFIEKVRVPTRIPRPSSGPRPPIKSSTASPGSAGGTSDSGHWKVYAIDVE